MSSIVQLIRPKRFGDSRGWFTEVYSVPNFAALGITCTFVQDNHSLSAQQFTLRGLHFQVPPRGQDKLVRCIRGRIFDVAVDIRRGSPTSDRRGEKCGVANEAVEKFHVISISYAKI